MGPVLDGKDLNSLDDVEVKKQSVTSRRDMNHRSRSENGVGGVERSKLSKAEVADSRGKEIRLVWSAESNLGLCFQAEELESHSECGACCYGVA